MSAAASTSSAGPVEQSIKEKLVQALSPTDLLIVNDSWKHKHHKPMIAIDGGNGETHFSITIVSDSFKDKKLVERHRLIYGILSNELNNGLHALSLTAKTPDELSQFPRNICYTW
ncbi:bola [Pyrrhoderma noxium]|uniref:Bola n=1 Tax=Pyrrhoderma noxium TaxID=2282107 RepID=A0A286UGU8_9AGAM|nr:bola [Pyrrhoderma noxium]